VIIGLFNVDGVGDYAGIMPILSPLMVESCKRQMPDVKVIQLTDMTSRAIQGVDEVFRLEADDEFLFPLKHKLMAQPWDDEMLFLDTDMLVTEPLYSVFDDEFDVAMVPRSGPVKASFDVPAMRYNGGFIASRDNVFFIDSYRFISGHTPELRQWFGDQVALTQAVDTGKYRVKEMGEEFNHTVESPLDTAGKVLHFKGPVRKKWMQGAAKRLLHIVK
jgi:hypothetical protein